MSSFNTTSTNTQSIVVNKHGDIGKKRSFGPANIVVPEHGIADKLMLEDLFWPPTPPYSDDDANSVISDGRNSRNAKRIIIHDSSANEDEKAARLGHDDMRAILDNVLDVVVISAQENECWPLPKRRPFCDEELTSFGLVDLDRLYPCTAETPCILDQLIMKEMMGRMKKRSIKEAQPFNRAVTRRQRPSSPSPFEGFGLLDKLIAEEETARMLKHGKDVNIFIGKTRPQSRSSNDYTHKIERRRAEKQ